ncbi:MAG: Gfo/Idh/MocA family protein [Rhodospirillales bacterium]
MTHKLRVGIAGYGVVGQRRRQVVDQHPDLETIAVCDRVLKGEGAFDDGVRYYTNFEPMIANEEFDVLIVCLTNDINPDATIAGLNKGLHVFCEKPPGRDLSDISRVISCETQHPGLKLKYGFNHRYHDSVKDALAIVKSGELGNVVNLRGVYGKSQLITFGQTSWRTDRNLSGGGVLLDQGIHMVDLLRLFAGEFTDVHSFISNDFWRHDVEDNAYAILRTQDGKVAMLNSSATSWRHRFHLDITLAKGAITLSGILSGSKSYGAETLIVARRGKDDQGDPQEETMHFNNDPSWGDEIADFADAIINNKKIEHGTSDDALRTMALVYRIYCADSAWKAQWNLDDSLPD